MEDLIALIKQASEVGIGLVCTVVLIYAAIMGFFQIRPLIANNTKALELMTEAVKMQGEAISKLSDRLIAHDERAIAMQNDMWDLCERVNCLQRDVSELKGRLQ